MFTTVFIAALAFVIAVFASVGIYVLASFVRAVIRERGNGKLAVHTVYTRVPCPCNGESCSGTVIEPLTLRARSELSARAKIASIDGWWIVSKEDFDQQQAILKQEQRDAMMRAIKERFGFAIVDDEDESPKRPLAS